MQYLGPLRHLDGQKKGIKKSYWEKEKASQNLRSPLDFSTFDPCPSQNLRMKLPRVGVAILPQAFIIEAIDLCHVPKAQQFYSLLFTYINEHFLDAQRFWTLQWLDLQRNHDFSETWHLSDLSGFMIAAQ